MFCISLNSLIIWISVSWQSVLFKNIKNTKLRFTSLSKKLFCYSVFGELGESGRILSNTFLTIILIFTLGCFSFQFTLYALPFLVNTICSGDRFCYLVVGAINLMGYDASNCTVLTSGISFNEFTASQELTCFSLDISSFIGEAIYVSVDPDYGDPDLYVATSEYAGTDYLWREINWGSDFLT